MSSITKQKKVLGQLAKDRHLRIGRLYVDKGASGATPNRTAFKRLLRDCEDGTIGTVLVPSVDRIARESRLLNIMLYMFRHMKIQIVSAKGELDSLGKLRHPWD
jgi:DNA invertase Pin-like site-specific DNA recombinase